MTDYRKCVFQVDAAGNDRRLVSCKVVKRMTDAEGVWSELPGKTDYVGVFLKSPPRMEGAPI